MNETISDRLKQARELAGLSLEQSVDLLEDQIEDFEYYSVLAIESDPLVAATLSISDLLNIAQIYKVSPSWLLEGASQATLNNIRDRIAQLSPNISQFDLEATVQVAAMMPKGG